MPRDSHLALHFLDLLRIQGTGGQAKVGKLDMTSSID